jgi:hypothetical protein
MAVPLPFISTQDLTDFIGQNAVNAKGTIVTDSACDICRTVSEQIFTRGTSTTTMDGTGTEVQLLPQYPVASAGTVKEDGTTLPNSDWVLDLQTGALIRVPSEQGYWSSNTTLDPPVVWNRGKQNVTVTYVHGWTSTDFPSDVRMVALSIAKRLYEQPEGSVASESIGSRSVSYRDEGSAELNANEQRILAKYKRY